MMLRCVMSCYEMKHVTYVSFNVCLGGPRGGGENLLCPVMNEQP